MWRDPLWANVTHSPAYDSELEDFFSTNINNNSHFHLDTLATDAENIAHNLACPGKIDASF